MNTGLTEDETTGSNAGPTDRGTNGSRNAPRASATGVGNASAEDSGSAFEDNKIVMSVMSDDSALTIADAHSMKRRECSAWISRYLRQRLNFW